MVYAIAMLRDRPTVDVGDDVSGAMAQNQQTCVHGCALSNYCNLLQGNSIFVSFYRMLSTNPWGTSGIDDNLAVSGVAKNYRDYYSSASRSGMSPYLYFPDDTPKFLVARIFS